MNRRTQLLVFIGLLGLLFIPYHATAQSIEPQHLYEKPGFNSGHAYDGVLPEETIDLFTGALNVSQRDVPVKNIKAYEDFQDLITRHYSSKIYRQFIQGGACFANGPSGEDQFVGFGWSLHFGRLWDPQSANPTLELPDGSRHVFYVDSHNSARKISKSMWILEAGFDSIANAAYYDVTSPGNPDVVKMRFYDYPATMMLILGRVERLSILVLGSFTVRVATSNIRARTRIIYARDAAGLLWPKQLVQPCESSGRVVNFNWDTDSNNPTLQSISFPWIGGATLTYNYTYTVVNGLNLLHTSHATG